MTLADVMSTHLILINNENHLLTCTLAYRSPEGVGRVVEMAGVPYTNLADVVSTHPINKKR